MRQQAINFAAQVKRIRQHIELGQEELAQVFSVSIATVNRWENHHQSWRNGNSSNFVTIKNNREP